MKTETIVFYNLRDVKKQKILKVKVRNHDVKGLNLVAKTAKKSAEEFKKMFP